MNHQPLFQVLTEIVEVICHRHLDDLRVFSEDQGGVQTLVVLPHAADYPRLVGKHGGCVHAMEYLAQKTGLRLGERIKYSLKESFVGERDPIETFVYNPDFEVPLLMRMLNTLAREVSGKPMQFDVSSLGDSIMVRTPCERSSNNETFISALESALRPYTYGSGRKLQLKPQFINHDSRATVKA